MLLAFGFAVLVLPYIIWLLDWTLTTMGVPALFPLSRSESILYFEAALSIAWAIYVYVKQSQYKISRDRHEDHNTALNRLDSAKKRISDNYERRNHSHSRNQDTQS